MQSKNGTVHKGGHLQVKRIILDLLIKTLEEARQYYNVRITSSSPAQSEASLPVRKILVKSCVTQKAASAQPSYTRVQPYYKRAQSFQSTIPRTLVNKTMKSPD